MSASTAIAQPVFLVGAERSGTTLLRLMLDHHPRIALLFESDFLVTGLSEDGADPEAARYRDWLRHDRAFQHSGFTIDERLDFRALVNDFLRQKRTRDGKELVGATVHHRFCELWRIWPNARYVYLLRDGRDVSTSVMRMGWAGNVYVAADHWLAAERQRDQALAHVDPGRWLEVRYEDLILDTRAQLERICAFLRVDYSDQMLDYMHRSTYQAPDPSLCYQWKTGVQPRDLQLLEERLGERLRERGYALSGHPPIAVRALRRRWLRLHSRIGAYRFRVRRFGVLLALQETLSRRLGLEKLRLKVQAEMNHITNLHMK